MSDKLLIIFLFVPEAELGCYSNRLLGSIYMSDLTSSLNANSTKKLILIKVAPSIKTELAIRIWPFLMSFH